MIYIAVKELPSQFKPYAFKSFKMKALTVDQAMKLGSKPTLKDDQDLLKELISDIDVTELVPRDVKFLIALLAFNARANQSWTLTMSCPYCKGSFKKLVTVKDFPPVPSLEESDPYPLVIDDGTHVYSLGFASVESIMALEENKAATSLDKLAAYVLKVDDIEDPVEIRKHLGQINDFDLLSFLTQIVAKYFKSDDTYADTECPHCKKKLKMPLSAIEVTQYTPFLDPSTVSKYKTNFRV